MSTTRDSFIGLDLGPDSLLNTTCPVCQEIGGIEPVSKDWIPIYDEKTGEVSYMPSDF
jgi:hypothetical protein